MPTRQTTTTTETDYGIDETGAVYWTDTSVTVSNDSQRGTEIHVQQTYQDTDGYAYRQEVSLSGEDYVRLRSAAAEDEAREELRQITGG